MNENQSYRQGIMFLVIHIIWLLPLLVVPLYFGMAFNMAASDAGVASI